MTGPAPTAGEQWARDELARLRDARFAPAAVVAFLRASDERARTIRRERPALARQARRWEVAGALGYLGHAGATGERPGDLARAAAWWAAVCLMLDWHLGMVESADGEPRQLSGADALTLLRAWLVPLIAADADPAVLALAGVTDALDGPLARRGVPTRAGRDLEGLVDAAVVAAALRGAPLPRPLVALELTRVTAGFSYAVAVYLARARAPSRRILRAGRVTTPARLAGLVCAAAGRRRTGALLLGGGSATSIGLLVLDARPRSAGS